MILLGLYLVPIHVRKEVNWMTSSTIPPLAESLHSHRHDYDTESFRVRDPIKAEYTR